MYEKDLKCSVSLPQGTVGWSAVCNCDIFWSYSFLANIVLFKHDKVLLLAKKGAISRRKNIFELK